MAKRKTTKVKQTKKMEYADGKNDRQALAKTVEDLMSVKSKDPFRLASGENFEDAIGNMGLSQLQEIAVEAGVFPSGTKTTLKNKLLKEYENRTQGRYGSSSKTKPICDPNSQAAKDILRIINE
jgi:hypothetical protein